MEIVEPASAVLGRPGWRQAGHGLARAVGGRVLAAWVAALGRQGPKGGRRACTLAKIAARRLILAAHHARTWHRAWHTLDHHFSRAMGQKGAQTGRARTSEHEDGGLVEVHRRVQVLELGRRLVSLRAEVVLQSRRKRWSTRDPAARHRTVRWGRGVVGGLAKGNAGKLSRHLWAEAGVPALDIADLHGERGGRKGARRGRSSR